MYIFLGPPGQSQQLLFCEVPQKSTKYYHMFVIWSHECCPTLVVNSMYVATQQQTVSAAALRNKNCVLAKTTRCLVYYFRYRIK